MTSATDHRSWRLAWGGWWSFVLALLVSGLREVESGTVSASDQTIRPATSSLWLRSAVTVPGRPLGRKDAS